MPLLKGKEFSVNGGISYTLELKDFQLRRPGHYKVIYSVNTFLMGALMRPSVCACVRVCACSGVCPVVLALETIWMQVLDRQEPWESGGGERWEWLLPEQKLSRWHPDGTTWESRQP